MKSIIIVAGASIYKRDGYRARISMEIETLKKSFQVILVLPQLKGETEDFGEEVKIYYFKTYNERYPFLYRMFNAMSVRKKIRELTDSTESVVYGEGLRISIMLLPDIRKYRFVFDCHGTEADEYNLYHNNVIGKIIAKILKMQELKVVKNADALVTVTSQQYRLWCTDKKHALLPMLPSQHFLANSNDREMRRTEMGIPQDAVVFVYSGNNEKWQMCVETLEYFYKLEQTNQKYFLIVYSHAVDYFNELISTIGIKNAVVKHIEYKDMPSYLDACDYGFCLRRNHIINIVASPTKVMEYLSRGVMPIITQYVGDFSSDLQKKKLAVVLEDGWENNKPDNPYSEVICKSIGKEYVEDTITRINSDYLNMLKSI